MIGLGEWWWALHLALTQRPRVSCLHLGRGQVRRSWLRGTQVQ
jgi:hypothetical protein